MKIRLDEYMVKTGLCDGLGLARSFVMEGRVFLRQEKLLLPSQMVEEDEKEIWLKPQSAYVSRGGLKLEKAIDEFGLDLSGKRCMDVGSSTGGFTDCMLKNGARHVYSIDVGYGLLDWSLRSDERVTVLERTNARKLTLSMLGGEPVHFASMDVSFISVKAVLPAVLSCMTQDARLCLLIKPQFEAPKGLVGKGGIVREESTHILVLEDILGFLPRLSIGATGLCPSPIKGAGGNTEFLLLVQRGQESRIAAEKIRQNVYSVFI